MTCVIEKYNGIQHGCCRREWGRRLLTSAADLSVVVDLHVTPVADPWLLVAVYVLSVQVDISLPVGGEAAYLTREFLLC